MLKIPRLSVITDHLLKQPGRVVSVKISVGDLAVFTDSEINISWAELTQNTDLSKAKLIIQHIPAEQQCMVCFQKYKPVGKEISCPHCGSVGAKILAGEEFFLESFEGENE